MGNVSPHFDDDVRAPTATAPREGDFEVSRTNIFFSVVSPSVIARSTTRHHADRRKKIATETLDAPASLPSPRSTYGVDERGVESAALIAAVDNYQHSCSATQGSSPLIEGLLQSSDHDRSRTVMVRFKYYRIRLTKSNVDNFDHNSDLCNSYRHLLLVQSVLITLCPELCVNH